MEAACSFDIPKRNTSQTTVKSNPITGLYRPWGFQEAEAPRFQANSAHEGGKIVSPTHRPPLHPRKYCWYSFLSKAESTPGPSCGRKDYVNEKFQWHRRESNLLACSAVPQHNYITCPQTTQCKNQILDATEIPQYHLSNTPTNAHI